MKKLMQWVLAATRPLVLTMGPFVLTMVFCGLGMFTSCSKDDNPESETEDPDVGAAASNYNINDADFTPTTWCQQEAIYIWDGTTKITDKNRKNPESYALVNLPWYEGEKQTNLPNGFCDDITPENGWEWVFNYCGRTNIPNNNFFGVYNKYFGILRVFFYMPSGVQTGNDHLWQISMTNNLANHYLWGYGLPYTQTAKNRSLLSRTGDGTQIDYVAPWVEITSDDGLIVPKDGWWAFDIDLSLYRPDADHSRDNIKLARRSWNVSHVSLHSTMTASIEGSIKQKVKESGGPSGSKIAQGVCLAGAFAANIGAAYLLFSEGDYPKALSSLGSACGNGNNFSGLFGGGSKPFEGQISLGLDGTIDTEGVIQSSATNIGVASPTLYVKDFFQDYSPSFGQGIWNIKNYPTVYLIKDLKYYFILNKPFGDAGYACFPYFLDPSSIEVELNPNVFPEDEIEWIQVNAIANASRRMGMTGTDRFRTAYGLQPRYRGESETGIITKVYGGLLSSIDSFDKMCNQYGDELNPFFDYMHASEDKGEMNFPALVIHEEPSDGKEQFIYGRGYQDIYALEPALLTYNGPYYGNEETNPASIFLPALEVNVTVSVKMKGKDNTFVFSRNYLPEIKDITLGDTYDIFKDIQNHQLNPKQAGHRAGYDYQVGRLRIYLQSLGIEFPD